MSDYITIKEAVTLTGKSDKTIRRNIIDVQESLNKGRQTKIVSKQGSKYLILKDYLIGFYKITEPSQMTIESIKKTNKKQKKPPYLVKYVDKLEKDNADLKGVRDALLDTNKELTRQNDQWQRMVAQLQQTNSSLLIENKNETSIVEKEEVKKESVWWVVLSLIVLLLLVGLIVFYFKYIWD